ncbi:PACE efflux transporter [Histidinibacterium aquaticum]|uniref:PACE efflux transporter n=1 Tax=Histidinibacterium aquaticum TaxID=2613962 RepID=A0A5J5GNA1_9RHOB|nr:PACE efflux transporter [Histidinibacterium aquaticum]KAA9009024.1 PACE efflux transporter [Histidinibacterium aquaticum]
MRSTPDRIRQAVSFELIGILIVTPLFAWAFDHPMGDMGILVVLGATAATAWNYLFNLGFDHLLNWRRGDVRKTLPLRVVHAVLFEATLLVLLLPLFAWWLDVSLLAALVMEISFATFYMVYAFVFTWGYDTLFPPQQVRQGGL